MRRLSLVLLFLITGAATLLAQTPVINGFSPATGPTGTSVTITGSDFNTTASNNIVFFGAVKATVTSASAGSLTVTVPTGATYQNISVTNLTLAKTAYTSKPFLVSGNAKPISFSKNVDFTAGGNTGSLAIADIDGDGKADIIVTSQGSNVVSVYRNNSISGSINGSSFAPKVDFATSSNPVNVAIGDLDGDGKLDLAVTNAQSPTNTISVFRNTSTSGTINSSSFAAKVDFASSLPFGIAIGDLDKDGKPDIVTTSISANSISVYRNTSTSGVINAGSFAAKVDFSVGLSPRSLFISDLDGDSKPDIGVASSGSTSLSILRNIAISGTLNSSSFEAKIDLLVGSSQNVIESADIDGDGKSDIITGGSTSFSVFRNISSSGSLSLGSFGSRVDFSTTNTVSGINVGDLDRDGKLDVVVSSSPNSNLVFRNISSSGSINASSFESPKTFLVGTNALPASIKIADLDGDGRDDLATANVNGVGTVSVLRAGPGLSSFSPGSAEVGNSITITGTGFTGTSSVNINGVPVESFTVLNDLNISAVIAEGNTTGLIRMETPEGIAWSSSSFTRIYSPPSITSFSPQSGPIGTEVIITGIKFNAIASNNIVFFGAVKANVTAASNTSLTVIVPPGADFQNISVTNIAAGMTAYSNKPFGLSFVVTEGTLSISPKTDFLSSGARSIAVKDFDGDGKPDLAVSNYIGSSVLVYRNTTAAEGATNFAAALTLVSGTNPISINAADLDGDGKGDLSVANFNGSTVSVYRNTSVSGSISFTTKADITVGSQPWSLAVADLNEDGKPEIAVTSAGTTVVTVLPNSSVLGTISFGTRTNYTSGSGPRAVSIGDIDGDNKPDLVVANFTSNTISVFKNTSAAGIITFDAKTDFATGSGPQSVNISDLDGDSKPDIVTGNYNTTSLSLFRNTSVSGTITLAAKLDITTGTNPSSVAFADINGDGKAEILTTNFGAASLSVFNNNSSSGTFSFSAKTDYIVGNSPYSATAADLNNDGKPEILSANQSASNFSILRSYVLPQAPKITAFSPKSGSVGTIVNIAGSKFNAIPGNNIVFFGSSMASVSASTDSTLTVTVPSGTSYQNISVTNIVTGQTAYSSEAFNTTFTISKGVAVFAPRTSISSSNARSVIAKDLDGDGKPDLAVANSGSSVISIYRNTSLEGASTSFAAAVNLTTGTTPYMLVAGDLDGDGKADLATANVGATSASVFRNTSSAGTISFTTKVDYPVVATPYSIAIGDLNSDGRPDLAIGSSTLVSVLANNSVPGTLVFKTKVDFTAGTNPQFVAIGDIDGDSYPDLATSNYGSSTVSVLRNLTNAGSLNFASKIDFTTLSFPQNLVLSDLDQDGKPELLVSHIDVSSISLLKNTSVSGTVSFNPAINLTALSGASSVSAGDLNGDGKQDLLVSNSSSTSVSVFYGNSVPGTISYEPKVDYSVGSQPFSTAIADLNSDGKPELIFSQLGSLQLSVMRNFVQLPPPTFASFSPESGASGSTVIIRGTEFSTVPANNVVFFGAAMATVTAATDTTLIVTVPAGANQDYISVTNTLAGLSAYSTKPFNLTAVNTGGSIAYSATTNYTSGNGPRFVLAKDLDGDGKTDLAVTNQNNNTVSIFRNTSLTGQSATFAAKVDFGTGSTPYGISSGDVDGDGLPDLAIANFNGSSLSILRNKSVSGTMSFDTQLSFTTGTQPWSVAIGDLNMDGKPEIVVTNAQSNSVSVFKNSSNQGSILLSTKVDFTAGTYPYSVAIGDIDGDSIPDLATANYNSSTISTFRNSSSLGSISFDPKLDISTGASPSFITIRDLDGDGKSDFAVSNQNSSKLSLHRNTSVPGTISMSASTDLAVGLTPTSIAVSDINGDGKPDLGVSNSSANTASVLFNNSVPGTFSFGPKTDFSTANGPSSIVIADLDNDGNQDFAVSNLGSNNMSVIRSYWQYPPPTLSSFSPESGAEGSSVVITGTNFNLTPSNNIVFFGAAMANVSAATSTSLTVTVPAGSNFQNISVTNMASRGTAYSAKPFGLIFAETARSFNPKLDFSAPGSPRLVVVKDFDGDGLADIALVNQSSSSISVLRNISVSGTTAFAAKVDYTVGSSPYSIATGDLDGDGKSDLAIANYNNNTVSVLRNLSTSGTISFSAKTDSPTGSQPASVAIADLNRDGRPDLAVSNYSSNIVSVLANNSSPGLITMSAKVDFAVGTNPISVEIADLDGDLLPDLVVSNYSGNTVSLLKNTTVSGSPVFAAKVDIATGTNPQHATVGDINGDGKPDIAVINKTSNSLSIFKNTSSIGTISFDPKVDKPTGNSPFYISIGDINGDGKPDIAVTNSGSNSVSTFKNTSVSGGLTLDSKLDYATSNSPYGLSVSDLSGDGKPDLLTINPGNSNLSVLQSFTLSPATITSISQQSSLSSASITITGTNFSGVSDVNFGGTPAASFTVVSTNQINAVVGNGSTGDVSVVTPAGTASIAGFTFLKSPESKLVSIGLSAGSLSPGFSPATFNYTISVPNAARNLIITPTGVQAYPFIKVRVNSGAYSAVLSGAQSSTLVLNTGLNTIEIAVTSQDSTTTNLYTLQVTRALSGNADLAAISLTDLPIQFFHPSIKTYNLEASSISTIVTATLADSTSTMTLNGVNLPNRTASAPINIAPGANVITILITAQNGTQSTYTFNVAKRPFANLTSTVAAALQGVGYSSTTWADYDKDGDMDFLLMGFRNSNSSVTELWKNTGGLFTNVTSTAMPNIVQLMNATAAWGDYDGDGDPDLLIAGSQYAGSNFVRLLYNDNGVFRTDNSLVIYTSFSNPIVSWSDLDMDGDLDFVIAAGNGSGTKIQFWRNGITGARGTFSDKTSLFLTGSLLTLTESLSQLEYKMGDYDNDGDPDILLTGIAPDPNNYAGIQFTQIWRNGTKGNNGVFTDVTASTIPGVQGVYSGDLEWVDYDSDGDLDFMFSGVVNTTLYTQLWRNNLGTSDNFTNVTSTKMPGIPGLRGASLSFGDLDNDGDPDLILNGGSVYNPAVNVAQIWLNGADNIFSNVTSTFAPALTEAKDGSIAMADYDSDGRLDFIQTGFQSTQSSNAFAQIWHNNGTFPANTPPAAPAGLTADTTSPGKVALSWSAATDDTTPTTALRYNLRIGRASGGNDVFASGANTNGQQFIQTKGNLALASKLNDMPSGTYYWSVQAIDNNNAGGAFAPEQSFTILPLPFTNETAVLAPGYTGVTSGNAVWGDYDKDGDLDFVISGTGNTSKTEIWRNNSGTFVNMTVSGDPNNIAPGISGGNFSTAAWGDIDKDGDLDLAIAENLNGGSSVKILQNNNGIFTNVSLTLAPNLPKIEYGGVSFQDVDMDGDSDLYFWGQTITGYITQLFQAWKNGTTGTSGTFVNDNSISVSSNGLRWNSEISWADYDRDGDPDLAVGNSQNMSIFQNGTTGTTGQFLRVASNYNVTPNIAPGFPDIQSGGAEWGDYDNDGYPDLLIHGYTSNPAGETTQIWRNNTAVNGLFVNVTASIAPGIQKVSGGSTKWVDVDNDGDLDILIMGRISNTYYFQLMLNGSTGTSGIFTDQTKSFIKLEGLASGVLAPADFDNDGDVDFLSVGSQEGGNASYLMRNTSANPNVRPSAPTSLNSVISGNNVTLNWAASTDNTTPVAALTYNVWVGKTPSGEEVIPSFSELSTGTRRLISNGNAFNNLNFKLKSLPVGKYYWSVQGLDNNYQGGNFAAESSFTIAGLPLIISDTVTAKTPYTATLGGQVNPSWAATTVSFEYGTAADLSGAVSIAATTGGTIGAENGETEAALTLSGLLPNTTYYFRLKATNSKGIVNGPISSFKTLKDAKLSALALSSGSYSPVFSGDTKTYIDSVANFVSSVIITPTAADANASIRVNGVLVANASASGPITLIPGSNSINIIVTAQDTLTVETYVVNIDRSSASNNADMASLSISSGSLSPAFASGTLSYSTSVENEIASLTITPSVAESNATVKVNGTTVSNGSATTAIPLLVGNNIISVAITAQDGTTTKTYTITVNRAVPLFPYSESFRNTSVAGMVYGGTPNLATLTATSIDADGTGYLRLTNNAASQSGFTRNTKSFPSANGLSVSFEYYTYGGSGGDGLSFFLYDASANSAFQIGAAGGSLGYAQTTNTGGLPGVSKGYLGIGLDEFGNFSNPIAGRQGGPGARASGVALRGDGNGLAAVVTNYEYLTGIQTSNATAMTAAGAGTAFQIAGMVNGRSGNITGRPQGGLLPTETGYRKAKVELTPNGLGTGFILNVWITEGTAGISTVHQVVTNYAYIGSAVPEFLSYGFTASTGGSNNFHEIRNLMITVPQGSSLSPFVADINKSGSANTVVPFSALNFSEKFSSPGGNPIQKIKVTSLPSTGTLKLNAADVIMNQEINIADIAQFIYSPAANYTGSVSFGWNGTDGTVYAVNNAVVGINLAPAGTLSLPYSESFRNSTASNMVYGGPNPAVLTASAGTDAEGAGYLRLTTNAANQSGFARNTTSLPTADGLNISFEYNTYGGTGADGLTFFLYDATANSAFQIGAPGGSLGYAQNSTLPGVSKAYLGFGFDEFGNFSTATAGRQGGPGQKASSLTIRGDGNGLGAGTPAGSNYEFLTNVQTSNAVQMTALNAGTTFLIGGNVNGRTIGAEGLGITNTGYRKAQIELKPNGLGTGFIINVWITEGSASGGIVHQVVKDLAYSGTSVPANLSYGLVGSTGGSTNFHEVRNLDIRVPGTYTLPNMMAINDRSFGSIPNKFYTEQTTTALKANDLDPTNLISPNGDGKNDTWMIRNIELYPNNTVRVFDRQGRLVFSASNYRNEWNGTFKGIELPADTYYYIIDFAKDKAQVRGYLSIMR